MKIVPIFAGSLFVFHYNGEEANEYDRLMDLWTDVGFLYEYAKANNEEDAKGFVDDILRNAEQIQDMLDGISEDDDSYTLYFEPLQESESRDRVLAMQKGKIRKNKLRIYAIRIDGNCFVITGGAIKMSQKMQDHIDTDHELIKLKNAKAYLRHNGVFDEDSFFELLSEKS